MLEGRLFFAQPAKGYRFNLDSVILGRSVAENSQNCLDLGAGCGIVGQIVLSDGHAARVTAVELCHQMVELAQQSAQLNHFDESQYQVIECDVRNLPLAHQQFDLILCNPPFFQIKGPPSPNEQRRLARHGAGESLADWLKAFNVMLSAQGVGYLIYPADELPRLMAIIAQNSLQILQIRFIHSFAKDSANRVIIKITPGRNMTSLEVLPPLIVFDSPGVYSHEVLQMLGRA